MTERIVRIALVAALVAAVLFGIVAGYERWRDGKVAEGFKAGAAAVQGRWDQDQVKRAGDVLAHVAKARKEEQDRAALAAKGERDAHARSAAKAASDLVAARSAAAAAGGLSGVVADLDRAARAAGLPTAATCPGAFVEQREAAIRARAVLGACSAEYSALAAAADDRERALTLRLDTAMSYINAIAPPVPP